MENNINWFPGHMAKTRRQIQQNLPLIDLVAELIDARVPVSSRNPELPALIGNKPHMVLLNKCDMADADVTAQWSAYFDAHQQSVLCLDSKSGKGFSQFIPQVKTVLTPRLAQLQAKGMAGRTLRIMVVGIPNVGKSSFINRLAGASRAKVANRPGVTRGNQWFLIGKGVELMDTPGVLWPKFEDQRVGEHLAFTGAIKDSILDIETLAVRLLECLLPRYGQLLAARYKLEPGFEQMEGYALLCEIGRRRGMKISGGDVDTERAAAMLLEEFRNVKIGRITLERPEEAAINAGL